MWVDIIAPVGLGVGCIAGGSALALVVAIGLWGRWPPLLSLGALAALGAVVGAGALLVQDRVSTAEWTLTTVVLGTLTPLHARLVLGRPRPAE
jgi:hypothetical protein